MFSPQFSLLAIMASSLALSALAQDSSSSSSTTASSADVTATTTTTSAPSINNAETTITALFGSATTGFVGSVVSANPCETTLAVVCDSEDPNPVDVCVLVPDVTVSFYFFFTFFFLVERRWELGSQPKTEEINQKPKTPHLLPHPPLSNPLSSPPGNRNPRPLRLRLHLRNLHSRRSHHHRRILRPRRSLRKFHRSDLHRIRIRLHRRSFHFFCHCGDDYG